ncbi:RING-H2 finger protein ATL7 [Striga hermonthica]|uniref:RING-H2 finger protein ATL7 n=1 Tax=Striga hermonthica TaxID=68872 RepID=A0A9N7NI07_STRHE|nr:RING-H2 finger protein ATL7 [Striga hermonthica]
MKSSRVNLVMTVIGFGLSVMFIVFVCTRLICARILLIASRRSARSSRSDLTHLERGSRGREHLTPANFPTKKYRELCSSLDESSRCTVCLADYHEEDTLCILPLCGHMFHTTCIGIWLQQHSTCPVCRVSLGEISRRKWFMQPMFSSAFRYSPRNVQSLNLHHCHCTANGNRHPLRMHEDGIAGPARDGDSVGDRSPIAVSHRESIKK